MQFKIIKRIGDLKMKKNDFITRLSENCNITKKTANMIYDAFISTLSEELIESGSVDLFGFASFTVKNVPEKTLIYNMGENKGKKYVVPPKKKINAKISSVIKKRLANA